MKCLECKGIDPSGCKIKSELDILADKWTLLILRLYFLEEKQKSFNEIKKSIKPITSKVLSEKLKKLVDSGYLLRAQKQGNTIKNVLYSQTDKVSKLKNIILQFANL